MRHHEIPCKCPWHHAREGFHRQWAFPSDGEGDKEEGRWRRLEFPGTDSGCSGLLGRIHVMGLPRGDPAINRQRALPGGGEGEKQEGWRRWLGFPPVPPHGATWG